ncbi:Glycosyl transferase family 2 [Maribacter dokdonensis]|uniref:glycosyltransferase family 2 protein n=1 Tax=Maribacter dokdonensis TaxID=320912 RepID=UPI001B10DE77|nr:glycosyltransferase family 2 protein [Maribacter dokdonensis]CAG2531930.1 Glycosyl transferase family 2 [Maribacter dokdonensis]
MKSLSIIIPHFNSKDSLIVLLNSIPNNDWIQTIVIDDNSNFNIFELAENYKHIEFFKVDKNKKGAGAARNLGLEKATGNYLLFADSDDYFTENAFEIIKNKINKSFDIIYFAPISIHIKSGKPATRHLSTILLIEDYIKNKNKEIFFKNYGPVSKLISTKLITDYSIKFEEILTSDDVMFSLMVAYYSEKIEVSKEVIYVITESDNSLTKQKSEKHEDCRFQTMVRYNDFLVSKGLKKFQGSMFPHLRNAKKFGWYKFWYILFYCKHNNYPIFYNYKHFSRILKRNFTK